MSPHRYRQGIGNKLRSHVVLHRPADNAPHNAPAVRFFRGGNTLPCMSIKIPAATARCSAATEVAASSDPLSALYPASVSVATHSGHISQITSDDMREHQTALLTEDEHRFITAVRDNIGNVDTRIANDPALLDKLTRAYGEARCGGLIREDVLADFLSLEMEAPGFHRHMAIQTWLREPGASPDDRFADLMDVLRKKSQQLGENT